MSLAAKLSLTLSLVVWFASAPPLLLLTRRLWKLPPAQTRRTFGVALLLQAIGAVIFAAAVWLVTRRLHTTPAGTAAVLGLALLISAAVECGLFVGLPGASRTRRAGAWLTTMLPTGAAALGVAAFVRFLFLEGFVIPTGAMATTAIGAHADRVCANCGYSFAVSLSNRLPDGRPFSDSKLAPPLETFCPNCRHTCVIPSEEPIRRGDRILADKANQPTRWDVMVFHSPRDRSQKYLSRLIGLPNEQIEILGGEVFINGTLLRKPPAMADELWIHVHDTKFAPSETTDQSPQWLAPQGSRWKHVHDQWKCTVRSQPARLEFNGPITDAVAYNAILPGEANLSSESPVGDVFVECCVEQFAGTGSFGLDWQLHAGRARLRINREGAVSMRASTVDIADQELDDEFKGALLHPLRAGDRVVFAIRDGQAYVEHAGQIAALLPFGPESVEEHRLLVAQRPTSAFCDLALVAEDCSVALSRIIVRRDVYYLGREQGEMVGQPLRGVGEPVRLESDEYFVLGDNSTRSFDSRYYEDLRTTDFIGVARCIYWPPSRWHAFE